MMFPLRAALFAALLTILPTWAQEPAAELSEAFSAAKNGFLADELRRVDAREDDWESEVFHDDIKPLVKRWVAMIGERQWDTALVKEISPKLQFAALRPPALTEQLLAGGFTVRRPKTALSQEASQSDLKKGIAQWLAPFASIKAVDTHVKIFRVVVQGTDAISGVYVDVTGPSKEGGLVQQNITWKIAWTRATETAPWQMASLVLAEFEEIYSASAQPLFSDVTMAALGKTEAWNEQIRFGMDHWRMRLETALSIDPGGINGMALGYVNGDGLEDLFYTDSGGLPKRLFLHQLDGTLTDATKRAGLDYLDRSRAALFVDLDNDGDQDLVLALEDQLLLMANDGKAVFTKKASVPAAVRVHGLAAADYDRDGLVDIYACSYGRDFSTFGEEGVPLPWDDANNGAVNALFRNAGDWQYTNVTQATGLGANNNRFSFAACWEDVDQDGWMDLYVANDFGRNNFYQNKNGKFTDIAAQAQVEDRSPGMACSWGDVNGDGLMDLQVSNMFSGAGNRIAYQPRYKQGSQPAVIANHQRFARGNSLLINRGNGTFSDESVASGITLGRWAWGHQMADINNDGRLDSLVGNGFITGPEEDDL
jgi:hypothetical protein